MGFAGLPDGFPSGLRLEIGSKIGSLEKVLTRGFEPPRVSPYAPEAYASAGSAT